MPIYRVYGKYTVTMEPKLILAGNPEDAKLLYDEMMDKGDLKEDIRNVLVKFSEEVKKPVNFEFKPFKRKGKHA